MLLVAAGIPSVGLTLPVLGAAVAPSYYAPVTNTALPTLEASTPGWLRVEDPEAIRQYFHGLDAGNSLPWRAWLPPLCTSSAFAAPVYTAFLCMALLLRRA